jgi:hypothetical protein
VRGRRPRILPFLVLVVVAAAVPGRAGEPSTFGKGVTAADPVAIAELLASPQKYVGRTVRIDGRIEEVCPMRGCWIDVAAEGRPGVVRVKVTDGEIVFPADAKGRAVSAEGVFERIELTGEQAVGWMRHLAEEKGEPFDPAKVPDPLVLYQIRGLGAVVR